MSESTADCRRACVHPLAASRSVRRTGWPTANSIAASRSASVAAAAIGRSARWGAMTATLLSEPARGGRVARYHDRTPWAACCSARATGREYMNTTTTVG